MLPNMNPQQMQKLMKQMGINSKEINAIRVIIEMEDENLVITDPQITEITMQGQTSFQIAGKTEMQAKMNEDDLKLIMEKTGCSREKAIELLKNANGDIAEAIMSANQ
ncbi:MAG: nascent polypeptide-associated complex protein [Candidatus Micrarchaeota archaeon]